MNFLSRRGGIGKILLHYYWSLGQPDEEKYDQFYNHLNFRLPVLAICRCSW